MSELVHLDDPGEGKPGTHAIVIGIGTYPWGRGISESAELCDLGSPARSAAALADWLICDFANPARPIASVSLVVSEGDSFTYRNPKTGEEHVVPGGTAADITRCVAQWAQRAGADFENGAVFYFCGHGISAGHRDCLLSRSFGQDPFNHLSGAFERTSVVNEMRRRGPRHQLFLFDACRTEIPELLEGGAGATPLMSLRPGISSAGRAEQCVLLSATEGSAAFGATAGISHFLSEFLSACRTAAEPRSGWWIRTHKVLRHMGRFLKDQTCQLEGEDIAFHRLGSSPKVPVFVSCDPPEHISTAQLRITSSGTLSEMFDGQTQLEDDCWRLWLTTGPYSLSVLACEMDGFMPFECAEVIVSPPFEDIIVDMAGRTVA